MWCLVCGFGFRRLHGIDMDTLAWFWSGVSGIHAVMGLVEGLCRLEAGLIMGSVPCCGWVLTCMWSGRACPGLQPQWFWTKRNWRSAGWWKSSMARSRLGRTSMSPSRPPLWLGLLSALGEATC